MTVAVVETVAQARVVRQMDWQVARNRYETLVQRYRKHINWLVACQGHAVHGEEAPSLSKMPSKAIKGWMYDDAVALVTYFVPEVPRPRDLAGIAAVITAVELKLAGLVKETAVDAEA